jgi:putative Mg2+ transporter-C (MgtC) family protein
MDIPRLDVFVHLGAALLAGGAVGIERSYHGRPAGFRTHTLVCLSCSLLMLVTVYQARWFPVADPEAVRIDPTRMAQGIVTGIGFLGAGVIFKEGLSVRGLTTAASIWTTAAIGILMGVGLYFPAALATVLTLGVLTVFRRLEMKVPSSHYAEHTVRFARREVMPEAELRALIEQHGFRVSNMSYRLLEDGARFEYCMALRSVNSSNPGALAEALGRVPAIREFVISPAGER